MPFETGSNLLTVKLKHRVGAVLLDVEFGLTQPWTVLFGPSGSGKTTVLRAIAGFVKPAEGLIVCGPGERVLLNTQQRVFLPPHLRPVRTSTQSARLFPTLTVQDNVAYGMNVQPHCEDEQQILDEVMSLMRLIPFAQRKPRELSGGEAQRVSVARTVAGAIACGGTEKPLLLLDEPFTGLDSVLRDELAIALRDYLSKWSIPVLSVSHDVGECYLLGAEIVRMAEGKIVAQGPGETVLAGEREQMLARLGS